MDPGSVLRYTWIDDDQDPILFFSLLQHHSRAIHNFQNLLSASFFLDGIETYVSSSQTERESVYSQKRHWYGWQNIICFLCVPLCARIAVADCSTDNN